MGKAYSSKARERCWKIYRRWYQNNAYKTHDMRYREEVLKYLTPDVRLLDAGCGSEMPFTREFSSKTQTAIGIDMEFLKNQGPSPHAIRGDLNYLPFRDSTFDIVISRSVLEHLSNPARVFRELARVLKPNGVVVFLTPNKYDYVSLISRLTPLWFHKWLLSRLLERKDEDTFQTFYRANTRRRLLFYLNQNGFSPLGITLFNQYPAYLMFSALLFRIGIYYERLTSRYEFLANLRGWLFVTAQKKEYNSPFQ